MLKRMDLMGRRAGKLLVIADGGRDKHNKFMWICRCDCGKIKNVLATVLATGRIKSCGCAMYEGLFRAAQRKKANAIYTPHADIANIWHHMLRRCGNPNSGDYQWYGARGISVCERWLDFKNFLADMGPRPPGTSLDRINVNGNYEPNNCRWATPAIQSRNKRNNVRAWFCGELLTISEIAERLKIPATTLYARVRSAHKAVADRIGG
jgi:hypothetical protein